MTDDKKGQFSTTGMALRGGAMLEQLSGGRLLLWASGQAQISTSVTHAGRTYRPLLLVAGYEALLSAGAALYGSLGELIQKVQSTFHTHTGLDPQNSLLVASFVLATWVAEFLPSLPCLNLWGPAGSETALRQLLVLLCRRPLALVEPSLRQLTQLPYTLGPTIILRQPSISALRRLLTLSADPHVVYGGRFLQLRSPVVVFTAHPVSLPFLGVALPRDRTPYRRLSPDQAGAARLLRPQLLQYRLASHPQVAHSGFDRPEMAHPTRVIARVLGACVEGDEAAQNQIVAALADRNETAKVMQSQSLEATVLEALLVPIHEKRSKVRVLDVATIATGILRGRQEIASLTSHEVGALISDPLGLTKTRQKRGYELRLDSTTCAAIHRQAHEMAVLSLLELRPDCRFCSDLVEATPAPTGTPGAPCAPSAPVHPSDTKPGTKPTPEEAK